MLTFLPWDTAHFGKRIARADLRQLDAESCAELLAACQDQAIECLYFLVDCADHGTIAVLQAKGFDLIDIRMTLAGPIHELRSPPPPQDVHIRLSREGDLASLLPVARSSYTMSRFFVDHRFGWDKAAQMFEIWLRQSITGGYADAVAVAEIDGEPAGFLTCHLNRPVGEGNIGLLGVAESARGRGLAPAMLAKIMAWLRQEGMQGWNVATQGQNIAAQRMYQGCGFRTRSLELWFHKWFSQSK